MPNLIIVGVANTDRTRDLTPTRWARPAPDGGQAQAPIGGGAGAFLEFFAKELFPYVEGHYRTAPYRIFAGHSFGGLLALDALVARPEMFNAVIAASPALNWDNDFILRATADFLKDRKDLPVTLFVTMADEEKDEPAPTRFDRLRGTLAAATAAGFVRDSMSMPEETHGTVVLRSHYWGLRKVFAGWQLPTDPRTRAFAGTLVDLKAHYAALSTRFGYALVPAEVTTNQLGYQALARNDVDGALAFFRYNVELFPGSANVYDSLAEALGRAGRTEESVANYEKAVAKARENGDRLLATFIANRDRAVAAAKAAVPKA